jgi:hypothetical protein
VQHLSQRKFAYRRGDFQQNFTFHVFASFPVRQPFGGCYRIVGRIEPGCG